MTTTNELAHILNCDYFNLFQLQPVFDLDIKSLTISYHDLQRKYHPDNSLDYNMKIQALVVAASAHINQAYTTLKNPLTRSLLLLELNNAHLDLTHDTELPQQFLIEQMELHEILADAQQVNDSVELESLEQTLLEKTNITVKQIGTAFKNKQYNLAQDLTKQLAFYQRLSHHIDNAISSLD